MGFYAQDPSLLCPSGLTTVLFLIRRRGFQVHIPKLIWKFWLRHIPTDSSPSIYSPEPCSCGSHYDAISGLALCYGSVACSHSCMPPSLEGRCFIHGAFTPAITQTVCLFNYYAFRLLHRLAYPQLVWWGYRLHKIPCQFNNEIWGTIHWRPETSIMDPYRSARKTFKAVYNQDII